MIGVWEGKLSLHGAERSPSWTQLAKTAPVGALEIILEVQEGSTPDWKLGDEIAIASSSFNFDEAEKRTINSINSNAAG